MKLPERYQEKKAPKTEEEAIGGLYEDEAAKIEEAHRKGKPHLHKGLPYEETEE